MNASGIQQAHDITGTSGGDNYIDIRGSVPSTIRLSPQGDVGRHNVGTPTRDLLAYLLAHQPTDPEIKHIRYRRIYNSLLTSTKKKHAALVVYIWSTFFH